MTKIQANPFDFETDDSKKITDIVIRSNWWQVWPRSRAIELAGSLTPDTGRFFAEILFILESSQYYMLPADYTQQLY